MSFETGKRALDFLIEQSGTRKNLEVDFFGPSLIGMFAKNLLNTAEARKRNSIKISGSR